MYPKQAQSLQAKCQEVENIYGYSLQTLVSMINVHPIVHVCNYTMGEIL